MLCKALKCYVHVKKVKKIVRLAASMLQIRTCMMFKLKIPVELVRFLCNVSDTVVWRKFVR